MTYDLAPHSPSYAKINTHENKQTNFYCRRRPVLVWYVISNAQRPWLHKHCNIQQRYRLYQQPAPQPCYGIFRLPDGWKFFKKLKITFPASVWFSAQHMKI